MKASGMLVRVYQPVLDGVGVRRLDDTLPCKVHRFLHVKCSYKLVSSEQWDSSDHGVWKEICNNTPLHSISTIQIQ